MVISLRKINAANGTTSRRLRDIVVMRSSDLRDCREMMSKKLSASLHRITYWWMTWSGYSICSMCRRAMARAEPPTRYKFLPAAARRMEAVSSARSIASERALAPSPNSARRSGPSGSVTPCPICPIPPPASSAPGMTRTNSTLPPPRSATTPSASGIPASTPAADNRASSAPSMTLTGTRHCCSTSAANASPSVASRTAAVASTAKWSTPMARANATKRRKFTNARSMPSGLKRPVEAIPRPKPHMTFSLNSGNSAAPSRSKTTRRNEFEPRSMTPMRSAAESGSRSDIGSAHDKTRVSAPECLIAPGKAGIGHEKSVCREGFFISRNALVSAGRRQTPALQRVAQVRHHDLVKHLAVHRRVFNRHERLHTAIEITRHPIGGADEYLRPVRGEFAAIAEANDAAMFEKAADDALDADVLGKPRHARPQAANTAHHQIDAHPFQRGAIEEIDDCRVDERIHLRPNLRRLVRSCIFDLGLDQLDEPRSERQRRDRNLLEARRARIAGHEVEQAGSIAAQRRVAGEER